MEWADEGIVLGAKRHGENALIVNLLTRDHGRHAGLVRGGAGKKARGLYEQGNLLQAKWRGRLEEHLGAYTCELIDANAARVMTDPDRLSCLTSACAVAEAALPEREPHPAVFDGLLALIASMDGEGWAGDYVRWELGLLNELGFGLDLSVCAATGVNEDLVYVSPKSGRAVSAGAGEIYKDKLLALPCFLETGGLGTAEELQQGLTLSGYFLNRHVFSANEREMPKSRHRLVDRFSR